MVPQEAPPTHAYEISKAAVHQLTKKFVAAEDDLAPKHIAGRTTTARENNSSTLLVDGGTHSRHF
jgi:hypothetical protein